MSQASDTTLVVMQPTFLPWLGYFALIASADCFVFLDDVQFSKQSWQSRNRIAGANGEVLLSLPVARKPSKPLIAEARLARTDFPSEMFPRIEGCLARAPFWPVVQRILQDGFDRADEGLAAFNIGLIHDICACLNIKADFRRSSEMSLGPVDRANRLQALAEAVNATIYLSPVGSAAYLAEDRPFDGNTTALRYQNFAHPSYDQGEREFLPFMSVIDAIAWLGPDATKSAILSGIGPHLTEQQLQEGSHAD